MEPLSIGRAESQEQSGIEEVCLFVLQAEHLVNRMSINRFMFSRLGRPQKQSISEEQHRLFTSLGNYARTGKPGQEY